MKKLFTLLLCCSVFVSLPVVSWAPPARNVSLPSNLSKIVVSPFWEQEWKRIRADVMDRFHTGSMVKFKEESDCRKDPIKNDVILRYGRALLLEDYPEAARELLKWAEFQSCISAHTARVNDLALSALAVAIIKRPLPHKSESLSLSKKMANLFAKKKSGITFQKGKLKGRNISKERLDGLKVVLNPGIMNCDLLIHTGSCIFQRIVKENKEIFEMAVADYPHEEMGFHCVDYGRNSLNQYDFVVKEKRGVGMISTSALGGYLQSYTDTSLQGPTWSCTSCDMIRSDFFCGRGLPACMAGSGMNSRLPSSGGAPSGDVGGGSDRFLFGQANSGSSIPGGNIPSESQAQSCNPLGGAAGAGALVGGSRPADKLLKSLCMLNSVPGGQGGRTASASQELVCPARYAASQRARSPQGTLAEVFESSWQGVRDQGCRVSSGGIDMRHTRDMTQEEKDKFLETLSEAKEILKEEDSMTLLQESCSAGGVATCSTGLLENVIDDWADRLANGEAGMATEASTGSVAGVSLTDIAISEMDPLDRGMTSVFIEHRAAFTEDSSQNTGVVAHELGHLVLGDRRVGVPGEDNQSHPQAGGHGGAHHNSLYEIQCRHSPTSSQVCQLDDQGNLQEGEGGEKEECDPDSSSCGCSGLNRAQESVLYCMEGAIGADELHENGIGDQIIPLEESTGDSGCLASITGNNNFFVSPYTRTGKGVIDCEDDADFCKCYSCGTGGVNGRAMGRCAHVTDECPEGTSRDPMTCRCIGPSGGAVPTDGDGPRPGQR